MLLDQRGIMYYFKTGLQILIAVLLSSLFKYGKGQEPESFYDFLGPQDPLTDYKNPSAHPGHLKQFGRSYPRVKVGEREGFPESSAELFKKIIAPRVPLLIKNVEEYVSTDGVVKYKSLHDSGRIFLSEVETKFPKKRFSDGPKMSLHHFFKHLQKDSNQPLVAMSRIPRPIKTEIIVPKAFKIFEILSGFRSTDYTLANISVSLPLKHLDKHFKLTCQIDGTREVILIDKSKDFEEFETFKKRIEDEYGMLAEHLIDYSSVDFEKFKELMNVKKIYVSKLEPGSCLLIPKNWLFQVNVFSKDQSFDINFHAQTWNKESEASVKELNKLPQKLSLYDCRWPEEGLVQRPPVKSLDEFRISLKAFLEIVEKYFFLEKDLTLKKFTELVKKDSSLIQHSIAKWDPELQEETEELFGILDVNMDKLIQLKDISDLDAQTLHEIVSQVYMVIIDISETVFDLKVDEYGPLENHGRKINITRFIYEDELINLKAIQKVLNRKESPSRKDEL